VFLWAFRVSQSPGFVRVVQFSISAMAMILPTLCMGATFPCVAQIASRELERVGHDIGRVYFVNTAGAIVGTVLAGFLLIPTWGLQLTIKLAVSLNLCLSLAIMIVSHEAKWGRRTAALGPLAAMLLVVVSPSWDARAMVSGVAIYGRNFFRVLGKASFRDAIAGGDRLLYYKDGISATVSVHRRNDLVYLRVNGKTDASNTRDMHTQLMSGHLPLFFRPNAKRVLVIGLGSGVTAGAVALHPAEHIDLIEIEPAVVEGAAFFEKENRSILKNPRAHLAIADGRNFLLASAGGYDVIISEPSNPWMRGTGNLFSLQFYELAARRLRPDGIVLQWLQAYSLFPEDLKMVVKTFRTVFPHVTIWNTLPGDLLLIGSRVPLTLDYRQLLSRYNATPGIREDMAGLGLQSPLAVVADFVLSEEDTARFSQHAWINTDDLPLLEFSAPESLYADTVDLNLRMIRSFKREGFPRIVGLPEGTLESPGFQRDLARALLAKGIPVDAMIHFDEAIRLDPRDAPSRLDRARVHVRLGSVLRAETDFKAALRIDPKLAEAHEALGQLYRGQKMWDLAERHLQKAMALRSKEPAIRATLAGLYRERRRFDEAIAQYQAAVALAPQNAQLWAGLGLAFLASARHAEALEAFQRALALEPGNASFLYQVGLIHLAEKRLDEAEAALKAAALKDLLHPDPHIQLGKLFTLKGEKVKALEAYRRALHLDPSNVSAFRAGEELAVSLYGGP
jgi:spermidine synthase